MATAYAALVSLINTISFERASGPSHPPIPFDGALIDALLERVDFLVEFLEQGWKGTEHLEHRITDLAYAAEDAIESPIVDTILSRLPNSSSEEGAVLTGQGLKEIIEDMDSIKAEMIRIKDKSANMEVRPRSSTSVIGSSSAPEDGKNTMVGFEEEKIEIMKELEGMQTSLQIITIHGMGGIGKTTLVRNVFNNDRIKHHFDVRAWATISQEYCAKSIFKQLLSSLKTSSADNEMDRHILGESIYKSLYGRRYLVILDDVWDIDAWYKIRTFFPVDGNGSRIILTTRLFDLANKVSTRMLRMNYLDEVNSWKLLCEKVFVQGSCPIDLVKVGKKIAKNCRGLPLAIVVLGGLLAKSNITLEYWKEVAKDTTSYLNDDDSCSKTLSLSYSHLPVHLKTCFLYIGMFPEDHVISATNLTNLWIAEGFLKSHKGKIFEEIADEYMKDLIERNLIMVHEKDFSGKVKYFVIHDLLRDLCMKEAQKDCFFTMVTRHSSSVPLGIRHQRRMVVWRNASKIELYPNIIDCLRSTSHVRSLIFNFHVVLSGVLTSPTFKLLRILLVKSRKYGQGGEVEDTSNLVNLRFFMTVKRWRFISNFSSNLHLFRNMQVLHVSETKNGLALLDIWNLPQVRELKGFIVFLRELPSFPQEDYIILENLQTITGVHNLKVDEAVCKRIPNVKKLNLSFGETTCELMMFCQYVTLLHKLESLTLNFFNFGANDLYHFLRSIAFPHSLKKLILWNSGCSWEDMTVIGSLPNLQALILRYNSFIGEEWSPNEGEFLCLKILKIKNMSSLRYWHTDHTHFPVLEELYLYDLENLEEIPLDIGEILTLRLIDLFYCKDSVVISAKKIIDEQQNLGNDTLAVKCLSYRSLLHGLEGKNFHHRILKPTGFHQTALNSRDSSEQVGGFGELAWSLFRHTSWIYNNLFLPIRNFVVNKLRGR